MSHDPFYEPFTDPAPVAEPIEIDEVAYNETFEIRRQFDDYANSSAALIYAVLSLRNEIRRGRV